MTILPINIKESDPIKEKYPLLFKNTDSINLDAHYEKAWQEAKLAADILKKEYGAKQVWVFGSLTEKNRFNKNSDIDLAENGIPDNKFYSAISAITRVIKDFKVDLVDVGSCRDIIKSAIEKEGVLV